MNRPFNATLPPCVRCHCGRLVGEHSLQASGPPPAPLGPGPGRPDEEWSVELHTQASPTNAYGTIDFQDIATRACRAKVCNSLSNNLLPFGKGILTFFTKSTVQYQYILCVHTSLEVNIYNVYLRIGM